MKSILSFSVAAFLILGVRGESQVYLKKSNFPPKLDSFKKNHPKKSDLLCCDIWKKLGQFGFDVNGQINNKTI